MDALKNPDDAALMRYRRDESGAIVAEEKDEVPKSKEEGAERWRKEMELMFLRGDDTEFDYTAVDMSDEYDDKDVEEQEEEEKYFDGEEPAWVESSAHPVDMERPLLTGQTGVQDF